MGTGTGNFSLFLVVSEPVSQKKFGTGKVLEPLAVKFGIGKSLGSGIGNFFIEKKYRYRYRKYLVPEKSIGIGIV